jgi:hypothetical protein
MEVPTPTEQWKLIPQFPLYEASSFGGIRNKKTQRELTPFNNNGYLALSLRAGRLRPTRQRIHRLVAMAFCTKIDGKEYVNHIDGNPRNNRADNLEWVTNSENALHYYKSHKHKSKTPIRITHPDGVVREFSGLNEAGRAYGLARATIWGYCKHGKFWGGTIEKIPPPVTEQI